MGLVEAEDNFDCCWFPFPLLTGFILGFTSRSFNIFESKSSAAVAGLEFAGEEDNFGVVSELLAKMDVGLSPNKSPKGSVFDTPPEGAIVCFN